MAWQSPLVVAVLTLLVSAGTAVAGAPQDPADQAGGSTAAPASAAASDPAPPRQDGRRTLRRFVPNLLRGTVGVISTDNLKPLFLGGIATGAGATFDDDVADWIADPEHGFGTSLETGTAPAVMGAVVAVLFATGRAADGPRYRAMTYDWTHAFLINAGYTTLLKVTVHRERPNGEDNLSFPSGHASNAFALAAVAERHYGWKAGLPAYTLAGLAAVSRLQRNKHYLTDVMAGATLGYIVGRTVVRVNSKALDAPAQFTISPLISKRTRGVMAALTF